MECNAIRALQRTGHISKAHVDQILAGLQWETCLVYLKDIIVLGRDATEMLDRLRQVFC